MATPTITALYGGAWKNALRLSPRDEGTNDNPEIAVNAAGAVFVAWEHVAADGVSIWAARRARP
jgi:hypothetical protein